MNIIKALIIKDLLQLKTYRKTLILFFIIFLFTAISQATTQGIVNMMIIMMALGFGMISVATFNYDEASKSDRFILTLPLTKREVVRAKYILVFLATLIGTIVGLVFSLIINYVINKDLGNSDDIIIFALGTILGIGLVEGIQIPCIYKYGAEKGRLLIFIFITGGGIIIGLLGLLFMNFNISLGSFLNILVKLMPLILILGTLLIYFISYKIACKIYEKREV